MLPVLIYSFAAVTLGGFDSLGGAILGGLVIAVFETMAGGYLDFDRLASSRRRPRW